MNGYFNDPLEKTDQMFNFWNPAGIFRQKNPVVSNYGIPNLGCRKKMAPKSSQSLKSWPLNQLEGSSKSITVWRNLPGPRTSTATGATPCRYHSGLVRFLVFIASWNLMSVDTLPETNSEFTHENQWVGRWKSFRILTGSECQLVAWLWGESHQHEILGWWNTSGGLGGPSWKGDGHDFYHQR